MATIKIGIVEDEMVIARTIENTLEELGYGFCGPACTYGEAMEMLEEEKPDLVLLDINLAGKKDGIDVAEKIKMLYQIPFIFLTANSDTATIERAKKVKPNAYLVKPFNKDELYATIEIAFSNYIELKNPILSEEKDSLKLDDFVFLKDGKHFHKVYYNDISYLESDNNYTSVHLISKKKIMIRSPFSEFLDKLSPTVFARTQRSYAININNIDSIETDDVIIAGNRIPISKVYREDLLKKLGI
jgi:DNA-binding LytR/AlgR family response regulator